MTRGCGVEGTSPTAPIGSHHPSHVFALMDSPPCERRPSRQRDGVFIDEHAKLVCVALALSLVVCVCVSLVYSPVLFFFSCNFASFCKPAFNSDLAFSTASSAFLYAFSIDSCVMPPSFHSVLRQVCFLSHSFCYCCQSYYCVSWFKLNSCKPCGEKNAALIKVVPLIQ